MKLVLFAKVLVLCLFIVFTSCTTTKNLIYFKDHNNPIAKEGYILTARKASLIKPYDELYIRVSSYDEKMYNFFNPENLLRSTVNLEYYAYNVNDSGFILYPFIGKLKVGGLSIEQAQDSMQKKLEEMIEKPFVTIKYINKSFTVLGEVYKPGRYLIAKDQLTLLEALGMAGDLTDFGDRQHITLLRSENDTLRYHYFDLQKRDIVESPYYFLKPDDVVYVEPLKTKFWGIKSFPFGLVLTSVTTLITVLVFMKNY